MFSLLVTVMAISLVIALAAATIYYGSDIIAEQTLKADALRLVNEGLQVKAASELHRTEKGDLPSSIEQMVDGEYLKAGLSESLWHTKNGYALVSNVPEDRCLMANKQLNIEFIPSCDDPIYVNKPVCCRDTSKVTEPPK